MVNIRIEGAIAEVLAAQEHLKNCFDVVSVSDKQYRNRAPSQDVRAYMTVKMPGQLTDQITAEELSDAYNESKKENLI